MRDRTVYRMENLRYCQACKKVMVMENIEGFWHCPGEKGHNKGRSGNDIQRDYK